MIRSLSKGGCIEGGGLFEAVGFSGDTGSSKVTCVSESTGPFGGLMSLRVLCGVFASLCLEALKSLGDLGGFVALGALESLGRVGRRD